MVRDYKFNNETDKAEGIAIEKVNFVINGNGHTVDADGKSIVFNISSGNITINNLRIINAKTSGSGAVAVGNMSALKTK